MATSVRLPDDLKAHAVAYADRLGISLNALIAVALNDYLALRVGSTPIPATDSPVPIPTAEPSQDPAPGRNAPCPCGSGLKYKRCCGR